MEEVWRRVVMIYKDMQVPNQFSNLTISSFIDPTRVNMEYPRLKGKGMECKDLLRPLYYAWLDLVPRDVEGFDLVRVLLEDKISALQILWGHREDMFLPLAKARAFQAKVGSFLQGYSALASLADHKGLLLWNMPSKFHWLWHLGDRARLMHPRVGCCLLDEDFVGKVKIIAHSCAFGTPGHLAPQGIFEKYRWVQHFMA